MKIGIMTFWHNTNYGGFLQGIATQHYLRKHGCNAELVNYVWPRVDFSLRRVLSPVEFKRSIKGAFEFIIRTFVSVFIDGYMLSRYRRLKKTKILLDSYADSTKKIIRNVSDIGLSGDYDMMLVGSDQVWQPRWQDAEFSYLLRGLDDGIMRISYASSVSSDTLGSEERVYAECLSRFAKLSVREKTNIDQISRLAEKPVAWVVDPSQLLSQEEWQMLLGFSIDKQADRHITAYMLAPFEDILADLVRVAKQERCTVHIFTDLQGFRVGLNPIRWGRHVWARVRVACSPWLTLKIGADAREFIQNLSSSNGVISDSFHALMFSNVFRRRIRVVIPPSRRGMSSRLTDYLRRINAEYILAPAISENLLKDGELSEESFSELDNWIADSKAYLLDAIACCQDSKGRDFYHV